MKLTKNTLLDFVKSLPSKVEKERDIIVRTKALDTQIRKSFADALSKWFCQSFELSLEESKNYVYVEGWNAIPNSLRGNAFFGAKVYADAALILPDELSIAIELDHGTKGSQIKNALAKAGFSVILGGYHRALVLFFVDPPKSVADFNQQDNEKKILEFYQRHFCTTLHLI